MGLLDKEEMKTENGRQRLVRAIDTFFQGDESQALDANYPEWRKYRDALVKK